MCTVLIFQDIHPDFPLLIAANRDESYHRPSSSIQRLHDAPIAIGGKDQKRGGTWMGANAAGIFVGVTNHRNYKKDDKSKGSRGTVVKDALKMEHPDQIQAYLEARSPKDYNPFNLLFGQSGDLRVAYAREGADTFDFETVPTGLHVLPNDRLNTTLFPKAGYMRSLCDVPLETGAALWKQLQHWLSDHQLPPLSEIPDPPESRWIPRIFLRQLEAMCIHTPTYGTLSSTIVAMTPGRIEHYLYCDGKPCKAEFEEYTHLLDE